MNSPSEEQKKDLIDRLIEGNVSDEEMARADELIGRDSEACRQYVEEMSLVSALEPEWRGKGALPVVPAYVDASAKRRQIVVASLIVLAFCVVGLLFCAPLFRTTPAGLRDNATSPAETTQPTDEDAVLARLVAGYAHRFSGNLQPANGLLAAGKYALSDGAVSLRFKNGVELALESPAEFELVHSKRVVLHRGKARAKVPQTGIGFVIAAPGADIEDLGTDFGVMVDEDRSTALRVFTGAVELQRPGREPVRLAEDSSTLLENGRASSLNDAEEIVYLTGAEIGFRQWNASSQQLRNDPATVCYYDFERDREQPNRLKDRSGDRQAIDGFVRGGLWISGRWPEKGALLFESDGDCVEVDVPGEFDAFTVHVWLRISRLEFPRQAIFGPKGWDRGKHMLHIPNTGELAVGVFNVDSRRTAESIPIGRWFHLAAVFDRIQQHATCYIDGRELVSMPMKLDIPLVFGPSIIGGTAAKPDQPWPYDRQFRGWIDEFALFSRALSPREIRELYEHGNSFN